MENMRKDRKETEMEKRGKEGQRGRKKEGKGKKKGGNVSNMTWAGRQLYKILKGKGKQNGPLRITWRLGNGQWQKG